MKEFSLWLVVILGLIALIIFGLSSYNESAASKAYAQGQARAMIIEAQSQARQDTAMALMPYVVIGLIAVFGGAIVILAVVIMRQQEKPRIETRYIVLLPYGNKREAYQLLSDNVKLLKD